MDKADKKPIRENRKTLVEGHVRFDPYFDDLIYDQQQHDQQQYDSFPGHRLRISGYKDYPFFRKRQIKKEAAAGRLSLFLFRAVILPENSVLDPL